jgi:hypothetical protein
MISTHKRSDAQETGHLRNVLLDRKARWLEASVSETQLHPRAAQNVCRKTSTVRIVAIHLILDVIVQCDSKQSTWCAGYTVRSSTTEVDVLQAHEVVIDRGHHNV